MGRGLSAGWSRKAMSLSSRFVRFYGSPSTEIYQVYRYQILPATRVFQLSSRFLLSSRSLPARGCLETMKMRLLSTFAALAIGIAAPALAPEQDSADPEVRSANPELRQQIEAAIRKYEEAYNKHDAAALAALYTQNAIEVVAWEPAADVAVGQQAIEKRYASLFVSNPRKLSHTVVQVYMIGNDICAMSDLSHHYITQQGCYVAIYVRDARHWKIRLAYAN